MVFLVVLVTAAEGVGLLELIPAPLGIGKVTLDDASQVSGFLCEPYAIKGAQEVTELGGWRAYIASRSKA